MRVWLPMSTLLLSNKTKEYRLSLQYHRSIVLKSGLRAFLFFGQEGCTGRRRATPETRDECSRGICEEVGVNILNAMILFHKWC